MKAILLYAALGGHALLSIGSRVAPMTFLCANRHPGRRTIAPETARGGFTLGELAIVMLIMSIFAAVTAPAFLDSLLFHRVETAARRVKADIEQARGRARLTSTAQSVTFAGSVYSVSGTRHLDNPNHVYSVDLRLAPYSLDSAAADFGGIQTLTFDGYGNPSSGGTVVLTAKSHQCTVTVNPTTGSAAITSNHSHGGTAEVAGG